MATAAVSIVAAIVTATPTAAVTTIVSLFDARRIQLLCAVNLRQGTGALRGSETMAVATATTASVDFICIIGLLIAGNRFRHCAN